jgi:hypothetical protein
MKISEFIKNYEDNSILDLYSPIKVFFSKKISKKVIEEFDLVEILFEFYDECNKFKQFEKIIEISEIIKKNNPKLHLEVAEYLYGYLIDYYIYQNQKENLEEPINYFISNPVETIDSFLQIFKKLVSYQYIDIVDKMIVQCFDKILKAPNLIGDVTEDLRIAKFELSVEKLLDKNNFVDPLEMEKEIKHYDMKIIDKDAKLFSLLLIEFPEEELKEKFVINKGDCLNIIGIFFRKYMKAKNICFPLSTIIYYGILDYWLEHSKNKEKDTNKYFSLEQKKFDSFLGKKSGSFFFNNMQEVYIILWGSQYVYDFLKSINFINEKTHKESINLIYDLKKNLMEDMKNSLWEYNFVFTWAKPDSYNDIQYNQEKLLFENSYLSIPKKKYEEEDTLSYPQEDSEMILFFNKLFGIHQEKENNKKDRKK